MTFTETLHFTFYNMAILSLQILKFFLGLFTWYDFATCDKLTTGLRHELLHVNQTYNPLTTVMRITKNVVGF